jgi:hypothetical protein
MSEDDFWGLLQFRMNRPGATSGKLGYCDGFEPKHYHLDGSLPHIAGRVGFVSGRQARDVAFTLVLRRPVNSPEEIDWATLLPPDGATGWLTEHGDRIEIAPSRAVNAPGPNSEAPTGAS